MSRAPSPTMTVPGDRLRTARLARKLTHRDVAHRLRVSRATIINWELGNSEPRISQLLALAEILVTTPGYILGLEQGP